MYRLCVPINKLNFTIVSYKYANNGLAHLRNEVKLTY